MFKTAILTIPFFFMGNFQLPSSLNSDKPEIDFSRLTTSARRPKVEEVYHQYFKFRQTINYTKLTPEQKNALQNLENSFNPITIQASLKLVFENSPEWGSEISQLLMEELEKKKIEDSLKKLTTGENKEYMTSYCGFVDPALLDSDASDDVKKMVELSVSSEKYSLRWNQVVDLKTKAVIGHVIYLTVPARGYSLEDKGRSTCTLPVSSWALKMKPNGNDEDVPYQWIETHPPLTSMQ